MYALIIILTLTPLDLSQDNILRGRQKTNSDVINSYVNCFDKQLTQERQLSIPMFIYINLKLTELLKKQTFKKWCKFGDEIGHYHHN